MSVPSLAVLLCASMLLNAFHSSVCVAQSDDGASPDETSLATQVEQLVIRLDARSLNERQRAERELIQLGPAILKLLPRENDAPSAETRQRLRRIRTELEKVQSSTSIDATPVTIKQATSVGDALKQITRQTQVEFAGDFNPAAPIDVDVDRIPFWNALDEVLDLSALDVDPFGGVDRSLKLVPRQEGRPDRKLAAYSGVFRIEPINIVARRDLRQSSLNGLELMIDIAWEPRLTPIGLTLPLKEFGAKLDTGKSLQLQESAETAEAMPRVGVSSTQTTIPFQLPEGRPFAIDTLSGRIDALLPGPIKIFDFDLKQESFTTQDAGDVKVLVESVTANGDLHEVRLNVKFGDADRALESHRGWVFDNPAFIIATDDIEETSPPRIENLGYQMYRQSSEEIGIGYLFDLGGDPEKYVFRYQTPSSIIRSEVRFTLHDIPLP
ncbi:MAG: hypothetical protein R3C05_20845 [Pirellulaceae bacterium]